jgi:predicted dehydrogenase
MPGGGEWREVTADDQVAGLLRLANGAQVNFLVTGIAHPPVSRFEAYGSEGSLIIDEAKLLGARGRGPLEEVELPTLPALQPGDDGRIAPFLAFLERFLPHLRGEGGPEIPTFRDGVYVQAVMDAMHQSARERRFVRVEAV